MSSSARGEDITVQRTDEEEQAAEALATAESFFEEGADKSDEEAGEEAKAEPAKADKKPAKA